LDALAQRLRIVAGRDERLRPEADKVLEAAALRNEIENEGTLRVLRFYRSALQGAS
jgi:hypothetical protein